MFFFFFLSFFSPYTNIAIKHACHLEFQRYLQRLINSRHFTTSRQILSCAMAPSSQDITYMYIYLFTGED